jgi:hypothetical protein
MVLDPRLLTFLVILQELTMDIRWFPNFVSYLDSPHPFGSCSRLVPDGYQKTSRNIVREVSSLSWEGGVSRPANLTALCRSTNLYHTSTLREENT